MFIVHNQNIQKYELVNKQDRWTEEFIINAKQTRYLDNWSSVNEITKVRIKRIIQSDNFIITFEHYNPLREIKDIRITPLINNKLVDFKPRYNLNTGNITLTFNSDLDSKNKLDFNDIANLNFEIEYNIGGYWYQCKSFSYWIKKNLRSKNIPINKDINVEILSEIEISSIPDRIDKFSINHDFKTKYLNFLFRPNTLKLGTYNKNLFSLEITKKDNKTQEEFFIDNTDIYDLNFSTANLFSNSKNKYDTKINYTSFNQANISIDSYSYYDKLSESVIVNEPNHNAKLGLLIPLKFEGIFGYEILFNLGKNLKNFKLSYSQELKKPFFSINNGIIKLKVSSVKGWLTDEKWHLIKYKNFIEIINSANSLESINKIGEK
ncbi:hypothetical protein V2E25_00980 [Mycoplasmopsis arginini]|uniref:Uncharacterized protein n=1 Tax=Mycoplasmopsis arginini TaxID=2094 RepID=A0ABZ2AJS4_MYCAR|nr:hypothetical protein [Mycoplasmopsis arginini]WVN22158.1 hypothetical protein V2E25_00980 [Mycoplasmopsis arginini]VEU81560.1 Uncharacterised protein [Mycoplasmopsis arginini]